MTYALVTWARTRERTRAKLLSSPAMPPASSASSDRDELQFPYWRRNLRVLPVSNLLASLGFGIGWPFLPLMVRGLGVERNLETWVGNMMLLFYVVSFVMNPLWGGIADHYGRKIMVLRATLGMGVAMVLVPFAPTPLWFAFLLMFIGVFNGATAAAMALLVANTPSRRLGRTLSLAQTGTLIGQTMGPAAGALLALLVEREHWLFWIGGGLLLLGGVLVATFVREVKQLAPGPWRLEWIGPLRALVAVPKLAPLYLLTFVFSMLWSGNVPIMSLYTLNLLADHPGTTGTDAFWVGSVAFALGVSGLVAMPLWGFALDRYDPARVLAISTGAAAVSHIPLLFIETPMQLVLARAGFGLSAAAMQPAIIRLLKRHAPAGMDARAISYAASFQFIAMGLAPFCAGLITPVLGLRTYFVLTIVLTVGALVLWLRTQRPAVR